MSKTTTDKIVSNDLAIIINRSQCGGLLAPLTLMPMLYFPKWIRCGRDITYLSWNLTKFSLVFQSPLVMESDLQQELHLYLGCIVDYILIVQKLRCPDRCWNWLTARHYHIIPPFHKFRLLRHSFS